MRDDQAEQVVQLVNEYGQMVFATAYRILGNAEDAEDALQEVFLKMWRMWDRRSRANTVQDWGAYLRVVASRTAVDILRRNRSKKRGNRERSETAGSHAERLKEVQAPDHRTPRSEAIEHEQARLLRQALSSLRRREARVFALRYFEGFSYEDIAEHMGVSLGLVGVTLHRARERLRTLLEPFASPETQQAHAKEDPDVFTKENNRAAE